MIRPNEVHYVSMGTPCPFHLDESKEIKYIESVFPGGEVFVRLETVPLARTTPTECHILICASITNSDDLMKVIMMTDALKHAGANKVSLFMPYVPYARQDRVCNPGESHSLRVFASLINAQNYHEVGVFDPHSDVTEATINNLVIMNNHRFVLTAIMGNSAWGESPIPFEDFCLVSPDAGALKKISSLGKFLTNNGAPLTQIVQADKLRNLKTGEIIKTEVHADNLNGANCVIVDDICDGGRTFTELASALKEKGAGEIALIVSHGIFSKGIKNLGPNIDYVVYSDSFYHGDKNMWDFSVVRENETIVHKSLPLLDTRALKNN